MRSILYYNIRIYIRQKYHIRWMCLVVFLFMVSYVFSTISITEQTKTLRELYYTLLEGSLLILILYYIVFVIQWSHRRKIRAVLHTQWASWNSLLLSNWLSGLVVVLYLWLCALWVGSIWSVLLSFSLDRIVIGLGWYLLMKMLVVYTFMYVISFFVRWWLAVAATISFYIWAYAAESIQVLFQNADYTTISMLIAYVRMITPEFVNIWFNPIHIQWFSANIFSIVLYYGIYTLLLLMILIILYPRIRRK